MSALDPRFTAFLEEHHVLTLATVADDQPQCSTLFYAFDEERILFVVASDPSTEHIRNA